MQKSKILTSAEDLTDANIQETEEAFKEVIPTVDKHRKSILKKLVKEAKEAADEMDEAKEAELLESGQSQPTDEDAS